MDRAGHDGEASELDAVRAFAQGHAAAVEIGQQDAGAGELAALAPSAWTVHD